MNTTAAASAKMNTYTTEAITKALQGAGYLQSVINIILTDAEGGLPAHFKAGGKTFDIEYDDINYVYLVNYRGASA